MTREKELILVVDDSPTNLAILNVVLREVYNVVTATNGPDALNLAASEEPDLIILDIMMPGMDGYEICDRLKANPFTKDIPVMFVTAMDQERQEAKGLAMGAVDYLAKPVSPPIVLARVRNQLELKKQRDFLRRLSSVDGLTGVANRRSFEEDFDKEWRRAARHQAPLTLLLADIDHLRAYNDAYGYLAGDDCLKMVAQAMAKSMMRPGRRDRALRRRGVRRPNAGYRRQGIAGRHRPAADRGALAGLAARPFRRGTDRHHQHRRRFLLPASRQ